ncbi:hypothetical protein EU245_14535 [Lentibacillus lipolyticus]|nr:hypothetical protein EU245_14535 [Lentibacillus lipolyticus]
MQRIAFILSIILVIMANAASASGQTTKMADLASIVSEAGLQTTEWQVTVKEEMDRDTLNRYIERLQAKNDYISSSEEGENSILYLFEYGQDQSSISEYYQVVIPKNPAHQAEFIAVFKGDSWGAKTASAFHSRMMHIKDTYFSSKSTTFACLTAPIDGKLGSVYFFDKMKASMNLTVTQTQQDTVKKSNMEKIVYGHTPMWNEEIVMDKPMNVQMVLKNDESGKPTLTIGTPILITEY